MATYCNQHWLLSHIRNSFISTDDTGMCETVMVSEDLPKHFLMKFQSAPAQNPARNSATKAQMHKANLDVPLTESDFICYPGLDLSDEEDIDPSTQSFDIQMEVGPHRFRSNTAQKLEKMDIARRKAARTKCINFEDDVVPPERDIFVKKPLSALGKTELNYAQNIQNDSDIEDNLVKSKLSLQLANSPKQVQNKFMDYARFDGTSQPGIHTKRIRVFLNMLQEPDRNYPIKICVVASARIIEVIGLVCYKATIQFPDIPLKSIQHYGLYMTEDNDDLEDFPPLDGSEPCSKFGFSHLTLAERRTLPSVTRVDYHNIPVIKPVTSDENKGNISATTTVRSLQSKDLNAESDVNIGAEGLYSNDDDHITDYEERILGHNDMLEAPMYRQFRVHLVEKTFFKTEVLLGLSGERLEIDQHKSNKFWTRQKAGIYPIEAVAFCEILERRQLKILFRIWLSSSSSISAAAMANQGNTESKNVSLNLSNANANNASPHSSTSPTHLSSPFALFGGSSGSGSHSSIRFKHYDFESDPHTTDQILSKLNHILGLRSSDVRREFLQLRERKIEKQNAKKNLKL